MRPILAVFDRILRGHDHPGFIACATGLTRERVERELTHLRAAGFVSKRRAAESWYLRRPRQAHSKEKTMAATKRKTPKRMTNKQQTQTGTRTRQAGAAPMKKPGKGGTKKR